MMSYFSFLECDSGKFVKGLMESSIGLPCGLPSANGELRLRTGLTLIAANTGHGKTSILNYCAKSIADKLEADGSEKIVLYLTLEEHQDDVAADFITANCESTQSVILKEQENGGDVSPHEALTLALNGRGGGKVRDEVQAFHRKYFGNGGRIRLAYTDSCAEDIVEYIRKELEHKNVAVVMLDYFQQMRSREGGERVAELKRITSSFRQLLNSTKTPFLSAVQFNRTVDTPSDMKASAIGESGDIERVADTVIGLFNLSKVDVAGLSGPKQKAFAETMRAVPNSEILYKGGTPVLLRSLKSRNGLSGWTKYGMFYGALKKFSFPSSAFQGPTFSSLSFTDTDSPFSSAF